MKGRHSILHIFLCYLTLNTSRSDGLGFHIESLHYAIPAYPELYIKRVAVEFEAPPANRIVGGFNWVPEKVDAQMDECLAWLRIHITLPGGTQFHSIANDNSSLNYTLGEGGSKYVRTGTTECIHKLSEHLWWNASCN